MKLIAILLFPTLLAAQPPCGSQVYRVETIENGVTVYDSYHFMVYDVLQFIPHYGTTDARYDFNGDGIINTSELFNVVSGYGLPAPDVDLCNLDSINADVIIDVNYFELITADGHTRWWYH